MASTMYGLLAATYLVSSVLAKPYNTISLRPRSAEEPKVIVTPFRRTPVSAASNLQKRASTYEVPIYNYLQSQYNINITLGTPPQKLAVQLDTGSVDLVIYTKDVSYCLRKKCTGGAFDPDASTSLKHIANGFSTGYGDGTNVFGAYASDNLSFGGMNLTNQTFGAITTAEIPDALADDVWGLMGVGYKLGQDEPGTPQYATLMDNLKDQGLIRKKAYSLFLNDQDDAQGNIIFGGVDTTKYTGDIAVLPMQTDAETRSIDRFLVTWDSLKVVNGTNTTLYSATNLATAVLLDSGGTNTILPGNMAADLVRGVGGIAISGGYIVPCALATQNATFNFGFGANSGITIRVPVSELVQNLTSTGPTMKFSDSHQPICQLGISAAASGDIIVLGDSFLRSAYIVYNLDDREIGLAQAAKNPPSTLNIQEIMGQAIPNARTTVAGTATAVASALRTPDLNPVSSVASTVTNFKQPTATFGFAYPTIAGASVATRVPVGPAALAIAAVGVMLI